MDEKILVTYATRSGSTELVAKKIGQIFTSQGWAVDVLPVKQVMAVSDYYAVVVGSAVRFGQLLPEIMRFLQTHRAALSQKPTAFFALHMMNLGSDHRSRKARMAYMDSARKLITPRSEAFFAGMRYTSQFNLFQRPIGKVDDYRDWDAIAAWAERLKELLLSNQ
jgi:menaquinone-dependent protoporphyrinogen oxidase